MDWTCRDCSESGVGLRTQCTTCESNDLELSESGWRSAINAHQTLRRRAEEVAGLLGFGSDSFDFSWSDHFETKWESANCRCGCAGYSTHIEDIPTRYLWMSNEDIQAEVSAKKAAKAKAEAEAKAKADRAAELRRAQEAVELAKAMAKSLPEAEARLAALQQGVSS